MATAREVFVSSCERLEQHRQDFNRTGGVSVYEFAEDIARLVAEHDHRVPSIGITSICSAIAFVTQGSPMLVSADEWHPNSMAGTVFESVFQAGVMEGLKRAKNRERALRPAKRKVKK